MSNAPKNTDDLKGRVKEAAGTATGNDDLKHEGKLDQASGKVKDLVDGAADQLKKITHRH